MGSNEPTKAGSELHLHLVEDHAGLRRSLARMFKRIVARVHEHPSAEAFLHAYDRDSAACLVLDIGLPGESGLDLLARLVRNREMLPTLVLSASAEVECVVSAMQRGAIGFQQKPSDPARLREAVAQLLPFAPRMAADRRSVRRLVEAMARLTAREKEVFTALGGGASVKQVALKLGMSIRTAHIHRLNVMRKLGVETSIELCRLADRIRDGGSMPGVG